ncbi:hypothetical protein HK405_011438, partial [Cladochytrium tenue]
MIASGDSTTTAKPASSPPSSSITATAAAAAAAAATATAPAATVRRSISNPFAMFRLSKALPPAAAALMPTSSASSLSQSSSDAARPNSARRNSTTYKSRRASCAAIPAASTTVAASTAISPSPTAIIRGAGIGSLSDIASAAEDVTAASASATPSGKQSRRVRNAKVRLSLQTPIMSGPRVGEYDGEDSRSRPHGRRRVAFSDSEAAADSEGAAGLARALSVDSLRHAPPMTWSPTASSTSSMSVNYDPPPSLTDDTAPASDHDAAAAGRAARRRWSLTLRLLKKSKRTARGSSPPPTLSPPQSAPPTPSSLQHSHLPSPSVPISSRATSGTPGLLPTPNGTLSRHASLDQHVGILSTTASARRPRAPLLAPAAVESTDAPARPLALGAGRGGTLTVRHTQACPIPPLSVAVAADAAAAVVQRRASHTSVPAILPPMSSRLRTARPPPSVQLHSPSSLPPTSPVATSNPAALAPVCLDFDSAGRRPVSTAAAADADAPAATSAAGAAAPTKSPAMVPYRGGGGGGGKVAVVPPIPFATAPAAMAALVVSAAACVAIAVACAMVLWRLQRVLARLDSL